MTWPKKKNQTNFPYIDLSTNIADAEDNKVAPEQMKPLAAVLESREALLCLEKYLSGGLPAGENHPQLFSCSLTTFVNTSRLWSRL